MTSREKAQAGLAMIREAIAEVMRDDPGLSPAQVQAALDLNPWRLMHIVAEVVSGANPGQSCC